MLTTVTVEGTITSIETDTPNGGTVPMDLSDVLSAGERISVSYTVDLPATDSEPDDTSVGFYLEATTSFSLDINEGEFLFNSTGARVQVDSVDRPDRLIVITGAPIAPVTGSTVFGNSPSYQLVYGEPSIGDFLNNSIDIPTEGFDGLDGKIVIQYNDINASGEFVTTDINFATDTDVPVPANDNFEDSETISGLMDTLTATTVGATSELNEPVGGAFETPNKSIWYSWQAINSDPISFDTQGSNYDTALAVFTGAELSSLSLVVSNDDDRLFGTLQSRVTFTPSIGEIYHLAVDGFNGASGDVVLNWGPAPETVIFDGTISLPEGQSAPSDGLSASVNAFSSASSLQGNSFISIPPGQTSTTYSIEILKGSESDFVISYSCFSGCANVIPIGFFSIAGTQTGGESATQLSNATDLGHLDIEFLPQQDDFCFIIVGKNGDFVIPCI